MNRTTAFAAPAKLNLFLRITGRRPDGFHDLQTVFQLLDWGDTIHLRLREDAAIVRVAPAEAGYGVPAEADLAVRAAIALQNAARIGQGVDIGVEKRVPPGGGFGGGSSDAATVLVALNRLWGAGLDEDALAAIGRDLGADVPVFVRGRSAWAEGVGDRLTPLALPKASYLVADPGVHVPTAELFQAADLTREAAPATMHGFLSGPALGNAFEPVLRRRSPVVDDLLRTLSRFGPASLTGTGGGCFVRFGTRAAADAALAQLPPGIRAWVADGVDVSPLHRAMGLH